MKPSKKSLSFSVITSLIVSLIGAALFFSFTAHHAPIRAQQFPEADPDTEPGPSGGGSSEFGGWFDQSEKDFNSTLGECEKGEISSPCYVASIWGSFILNSQRYIQSGTTYSQELASLMFTSPVKTTTYYAYLKRRVGIEPAYAQGVGFSGLEPIINLWSMFRNIAYLFFTLVFAVVGLMVILRKRIDPRTVVTVQDSLPRIVMALLLVTFSYAIAGLMIDISELTTRVMGNLMLEQGFISQEAGTTPGRTTSAAERNMLNRIFNANIFQLVSGQGLGNTDILKQTIREADLPIINWPGVGRITVIFVLDVTMFFISWKIFFSLLGPYVSVVLLVILAPLYLALSALPGAGGGDQVFGWIKKLVANVAVFPAVFTMLAIAAALKSGSAVMANSIWNTHTDNAITGFWSPTVIGDWGPAVGELLALGILLAVPRTADAVKQTLQLRSGAFEEGAKQSIQQGFGRLPFVGGMMS